MHTHQDLGITKPKFVKILSDLEESSSMLMQEWALRYSHPL